MLTATDKFIVSPKVVYKKIQLSNVKSRVMNY